MSHSFSQLGESLSLLEDKAQGAAPFAALGNSDERASCSHSLSKLLPPPPPHWPVCPEEEDVEVWV